MHSTGFYNNPNRHFALVRVLRSVLGDIAYARPSNEMLDSGDLTLNEMRQEGKHLIILYNDANAVKSEYSWCAFSENFGVTSERRRRAFDQLAQTRTIFRDRKLTTKTFLIFLLDVSNVANKNFIAFDISFQIRSLYGRLGENSAQLTYKVTSWRIIYESYSVRSLKIAQKMSRG